MNFLAHCALGGEDPELIVGGFLGDFVKGPVPAELPAGIQRGIRLHRRIDAFSNRQPDIKDSVLRFKPPLRRLAPVLVDIVADHFLATTFPQHYGEPLEALCNRTYAALRLHARWLPEPARRFGSMIEDTDLFGRYRRTDVVERAFRRVAERLGMLSKVNDAIATLRGDYDGLRDDFDLYFPAIRGHTNDWLATLPPPALQR